MADLGNIKKFARDILKRELAVLWAFSVLLGFALIALSAKNKLPLGAGDFVFITLLALLVSLYRPRWIFFLFIGLVPLENIIFASGFLPIQLRPYQFVGGMLIIGTLILYLAKKLGFKLLKPSWLDWLVLSLIPLSFLPLLAAESRGMVLKNNLILVSFVALYWLARNFIRSRKDVLKTAFFFLGSYIVVAIYGFYQVLADKFGAKSFEVMFGRPNSTFAEPDWLGIYLCFALAVLLSLIFYLIRDKKEYLLVPRKYALLLLDALLVVDIILIILTLSRSAWVGAAAIAVFYLLLNLAKENSKKNTFALRELVIIFLISLISLAAVHFGKLSKFDIFDRARSTTTSEQKITIACDDNKNVPEVVASTDALEKYGCRHINLEEIESQRSQGKTITEIFRKDPNVLTRSAIYRKSWEIFKVNPIFGVGFGTITQALGTDERGAGLNESNIFLQIWAGSGILGLAAFITALGYLFIYSFRRVSPICLLNNIFGYPTLKNDSERALNVFAVLGILAFIVPNLFNAGLFMGIFWMGLAMIASIHNIYTD